MKKRLLKILSTSLIGCSLFAVPASAEWKQDSKGWWYAEGSSYATGWRYIDGEWYYFKDDGYMFNSPNCTFFSNLGSYGAVKSIYYNGNNYYFDKDGHMLHDCFIVEGSGVFQAWLNSNGILTEGTYGNKYEGHYDLSQVKKVIVPNIIGMSFYEAKTKLDSLNLVLVKAGEETSKEYPEGTIMKMNPDVGSNVNENSEVRVIISSGENKLKMPDVVEYDYKKAKNLLEALGITNIETNEAYSDYISSGEIISQTPKEDSSIDKNMKITLVVSKGPKMKNNSNYSTNNSHVINSNNEPEGPWDNE